ncbi:H3 K56 histone acetylation KAT11 protein [Rutstroemia sp. NJR-2017a BVV2]|nr:H3 K56 histone acetylation KAT11 protein [Rutstroemia sp. NJR-2017a BVV2]
MAAHDRRGINGSINYSSSSSSSSLIQQLASVLAKDISFKIYHLSTPPTKTSSLYSAPPNGRPDKTYCESHFLTVSIQTPSQENAPELSEVLVFAIEILIYSTAYDTTFFVSKADSTGYLHLLNLPKGTPSPIREISGIFLRHLVDQHQRKNIKSVVSLFARAQDQYLFPGSVEYSGKHVLDDRGLVRWWCRVLDPLIETTEASIRADNSAWEAVKGFLIVPGQDEYETRSYLPARAKLLQSDCPWTIGHPLKQISRHLDDIPPRCLVPHYPDDPKARFLDELDEEIDRSQGDGSGHWKSVKSIDQFWEMMAYRQECSAGRLVGFIWIVFTPLIKDDSSDFAPSSSQSTVVANDTQPNSSFVTMPDRTMTAASTPSTSFAGSFMSTDLHSKKEGTLPGTQQAASPSAPSRPRKKRKKLSGIIVPRQPRIKTENKNYLLDKPENTAYYSWRAQGRGQVIVDETDYNRITELLLRLDFANLELASSSSRRWINEVRSGAGSMSSSWGATVTGTRAIETAARAGEGSINTLNVGLVRKKRKAGAEDVKESTPGSAPTILQPEKVNLLGAGMIRKKAKT